MRADRGSPTSVLVEQVGGAAEAGCRSRRRSGPDRTIRGARECGDRQFADLTRVGVVGHRLEGVDVVAGDDVDHLLAVVGKRPLQVGGDDEVPRLAITSRQGLVGDLPQHLLGEAVRPALRRERVGRHLEHLAAQQIGQDPGDLVGFQSGHGDDRLGREARPEHGGVGEHMTSPGVEHVEAGRQQGVQAVGHLELADVADDPVHALDRLHDVAVDQGADALDGVQRDALGALDDRRSRPAPERPGSRASTSASIDV